jgi:hypothetical protein
MLIVSSILGDKSHRLILFYKKSRIFKYRCLNIENEKIKIISSITQIN